MTKTELDLQEKLEAEQKRVKWPENAVGLGKGPSEAAREPPPNANPGGLGGRGSRAGPARHDWLHQPTPTAGFCTAVKTIDFFEASSFDAELEVGAILPRCSQT